MENSFERQQKREIPLPCRTDLDDPEAFGEFYHRYADMVRNFFVRRKGYSDVDDLVQEVFIRFWQQPQQFRGEAAVSTYLIGIARRVLKQMDQKFLPVLAGDSDILEQVADEPWDAEADAKYQYSLQLLPKILAQLPPEYQQAIQLLEIQEKSFPEAARIMGCTIETARKRLVRGLKALRKHLLQTPRFSKLKDVMKILFL